MRMARRSTVIAKIVASLMIVSTSIALAADRLPGLGSKDAAGTGVVANAPIPSVKITGHVTGMYPGRVATVKVRLKNPGSVAVVAKKVSATVGDAGPGCDAANLVVQRARKVLRIRPHGRAKVTLQATMLPSAPDACQGLSFPLSFHAKVRAA